MSSSNSVTTWICKLKEGNPDAAQQLWERYFARLVQLARARLSTTSTRVSDEEDVAISAFHSFCMAVKEERFPQLHNRDDLWQILVMHTARKVVTQQRHQSRLKRGGQVVHEHGDALLQVIGNEPAPDFAAEVAEQFQFLLNLLDSEDLRLIALRRLEGFTNSDIAIELQLGESTVRRKIGLIRRCWEEVILDTEKE